MASPTRMAPAVASPNAGMKAIEFTWMTTLRAASGVVPRAPTTTLTNSANAANSSSQFTPFGAPKRTTRRNSSRRMRTSPFGSSKPTSRENATSMTVKPTNVAMVLAAAAPITP